VRHRQPFAEVVRIAEEAVSSAALPSVVLAVARGNGEPFVQVCPGGDGATAGTIFPIASITKPILGTAIMQLVEGGHLLLNAPVARYLPDFGQNGKEAVTTWHLLTHTSGVIEDMPGVNATFAQRAPASEWLRFVLEAPLAFPPGSRFAYCAQAFWVLAELVTLLSGMPYHQYLRESVFAPLEMAGTGFSPVDGEGAAPVHDFWWPAGGQTYFDSVRMPGGGLWSTASDLLTFGRAFLKGGRPLLGRAACQAMTRLQTTGIADEAACPALRGLAWQKRHPTDLPFSTASSFGHGGGTGSLLWVDPGLDLVFVWLSSRWGADFDPILRALTSVSAEVAG
jgi:CubicO group peptidase (beta-lactamase class C family)